MFAVGVSYFRHVRLLDCLFSQSSETGGSEQAEGKLGLISVALSISDRRNDAHPIDYLKGDC